MVKNELTEKAPFLSLPLAKNAAIFNKKIAYFMPPLQIKQ